LYVLYVLYALYALYAAPYVVKENNDEANQF